MQRASSFFGLLQKDETGVATRVESFAASRSATFAEGSSHLAYPEGGKAMIPLRSGRRF
jgi:hypothetical protein